MGLGKRVSRKGAIPIAIGTLREIDLFHWQGGTPAILENNKLFSFMVTWVFYFYFQNINCVFRGPCAVALNFLFRNVKPII
jgi:hypothetical protein